MGSNFSSTFFKNSIPEAITHSAVLTSVVLTTPVWLTAIGLYKVIDRIHSPLGDAILRGLGLYDLMNSDVPGDIDGNTYRQEELRNRLVLTGQYYDNEVGANQLGNEFNEQHSLEGIRLLKQIEQKNKDVFNDSKDFDLSWIKEIPKEFICPLTLSIMIDPVAVKTEWTQNGSKKSFTHFFERSAIEPWINKYKINPINKQLVTTLTEATELKKDIKTFITTAIAEASKNEPTSPSLSLSK